MLIEAVPPYRWFAVPSVKAVDSAHIIENQSWFDEAYADGVRLFVMHAVEWHTCKPWARTEPQLAMALKAGMKVAVYTRNPMCWENGILAAGALRHELQFFAIDVETDPGIPATAAMVSGVQAMGVRPVIYSGSAMWHTIMGDRVKDFSKVPLWDGAAGPDARGEWVGDVLSPAPVPYGGWNTFWNMRIGVQQAFEYTLRGVPVDLNSFDQSFLR